MKSIMVNAKLILLLGAFTFSGINAESQISFNKKFQVGEPSRMFGQTITGIAQDIYGFIWLTSMQGLLQYDGNSFKAYRHNPLDSNSLGYGSPSCLFIDDENIVWIGTLGGGLDRFDPFTNRFSHFRNNPKKAGTLSSDSVFCLLKDSQGKFWVGTKNGLNLFDPKDGSFTVFNKNVNDPRTISDNVIRVIYEDRQGTLWIGCGSPWWFNNDSTAGGLNRYERKAGTFTRYYHNPGDPNSLETNIVTALYEDSQGNFWVGTTNDGLHQMDRRTGKFTHFYYNKDQPEKISRPPVLKNDSLRVFDNIRFITEDVKGGLWIGSLYGGMNRFDRDTRQRTHYGATAGKGQVILSDTAEGFHHYLPFQKLNSRDGLLWIVTADGGVYSVNFSTQKLPFNPMPGYSVISFNLEEKKNVLWIGTDKGVIKRNLLTNQDKLYQFEAGNEQPGNMNIVNSIKVDQKGNVWIGTSDGLNMLNPETEQITTYRHNPRDTNSLAANGIYAIKFDDPDHVWIGTSKGLDQLNLRSLVFTHFNQNVKNNPNAGKYTVYDIEFDDNKNLWLGTSGGLDFIERATGSVTHYLQKVSIWCILIDVNKAVWTTSATGLYVLDKRSNRFIEFLNPKTNGRFFDIIDILEDDKHFMWVRATNEILRISPDHQEVRVYSGKKGAKECNPAFDRYNITDSKGNVYMVADEGYHVFHPDSLNEKANLLPVVFYELKVNNRVILAKSHGILQVPVFKMTDLKLNFAENDFSLKFLSFDYTEDEKINYYAKLEGYDKDWRFLGSYNNIDYYNVPPGRYVFHTRAINSEGYSSEKAITIIVRSPWWQTWWAYSLYALLFVVGIGTIIAYRSRRLRKENIQLEAKVSERTSQLNKSLEELKGMQQQLIHSEKMASLGELTAGIAHEIQNPLNFVNNFSELNHELVSELKDAIDRSDHQQAKLLAENIGQNEMKIEFHGKRADTIVKNMLQHSRAGKGKTVLTDLNALVDEYMRLSFYGLKAKDKNFDAKCQTNFDPALDKSNIVPEDLGRVILNLINNAFYAVTEKKKKVLSGGDGVDYEPTVTVTTRKKKNGIEVIVADNGSGIPVNLLSKIFQPFFTTKPAGQGTGLGLSLSYDIVKAHGGQLKAESAEGKGALFIISLPFS